MNNTDKFNGYEISPIAIVNESGFSVPYHYDGQTFVDVTEDCNASAYAIYAHFNGIGVVWLEDWLTYHQAVKAVKKRIKLLRRLSSKQLKVSFEYSYVEVTCESL